MNDRPSPEGAGSLMWACLGLGAIFALAVGVRAFPWPWVFPTEGEVIFSVADAHYHVRRALYSFLEFPDVMLWDQYINHPGGATIAWPPLFDYAIAAVARLLVDDVPGFERVAAWASPVAGALTTVPIFVAARQLASRSIAFGAAIFYALLPAPVLTARLGHPDHHTTVAMIGAWLLAICLAAVRTGADPLPRSRALRLALGLAVARTALLFTWHGSLLYLVLLDGILLFTCAATRRRDLLLIEAGSNFAAAPAVALFLALAPTPLGGSYSAISLSALHLIAVCAVGCVAAAGWVLETLRPGRSPAVRFVWLALAGVVFLGVVLLFPGPRAGLLPAFQFMTLGDAAGASTAEQRPFFPLPGREGAVPTQILNNWGFYAYAIPLLPFVALATTRRPGRRAAGWALSAWVAYFGTLTLLQRRYGTDLAPVASVVFALGLGGIGRVVTRRFERAWLGATAALALAVAGFSPALTGFYAPTAQDLHAVLTRETPGDRALETANGSLRRFLVEVRRLTPETSGYHDTGVEPEYGVVAHPSLGHALHYVARRATPADPFSDYIGPDNWDATFSLLRADSESDALEIAEALRARYVLTRWSTGSRGLETWLQNTDGLRTNRSPRLERFRLVSEGPAGGSPLSDLFKRERPDVVIPYKLFEIVPGARLEVDAPPGESIQAAVILATPTGRRIHYRAGVVADERGTASLRVPYPSRGLEARNRTDVRALSRYRVRTARREAQIEVGEDDVREGRAIRVDLTDPGNAAR